MSDDELQRRLLFILHRGLVEIRILCQGPNNSAQVFDLADAIELIPGYLNAWHPDHFELIRFALNGYQKKYAESSFDYLRYLEIDTPPSAF